LEGRNPSHFLDKKSILRTASAHSWCRELMGWVSQIKADLDASRRTGERAKLSCPAHHPAGEEAARGGVHPPSRPLGARKLLWEPPARPALPGSRLLLESRLQPVKGTRREHTELFFPPINLIFFSLNYVNPKLHASNCYNWLKLVPKLMTLKQCCKQSTH